MKFDKGVAFFVLLLGTAKTVWSKDESSKDITFQRDESDKKTGKPFKI